MIAGECRCGQVRFEITAPPLVTMACHCTGCRRMTGSAFSLSALVPAAGFAVTAGDPVIGGLHGAARHYHCPHCLSWLFTRPEGMDDFVNVRATMTDDVALATPFIECCTDEKLPWTVTGARYAYPGFPGEGDFPTLVAEYRAA